MYENLSLAELLKLTVRENLKANKSPEETVRWLVTASIEEIMETKAINMDAARKLKAAMELGRRLSKLPSHQRPVIKCPADVASLLMDEMRYLDREHFKVLLLDTKHGVLDVILVSVGGLSQSLVHPREVFKEAIRRSTAAVILVHNHPSGDTTPSNDDTQVTKRLVQAGELLGIKVLDHLIIGDGLFVSLKDMGVMK